MRYFSSLFFSKSRALQNQLLEKTLQPAQFDMGADSRAHLIDVERLGDEVGGSQIKTFDLLLAFVDDRDKDDRDADCRWAAP